MTLTDVELIGRHTSTDRENWKESHRLLDDHVEVNQLVERAEVDRGVSCSENFLQLVHDFLLNFRVRCEHENRD